MTRRKVYKLTYTSQEKFIDEIVAKYLVYVKERCGEHLDCQRIDRFKRFVEVEKTTIPSLIDFENIQDDVFADILWIYYVAEYIQLYDRYHPNIPMRFHQWVLCEYGFEDVDKFELRNKSVHLLIHYINDNQYNVLNKWYGSCEVCLK
jgi:hypothetical protein